MRVFGSFKARGWRCAAIAVPAAAAVMLSSMVNASAVLDNTSSGAGNVHGLVKFNPVVQSNGTTTTGVPRLLAPPDAVSWGFSGSSTGAAVVNINLSQYAGGINLSVTGSDPFAEFDREINGTINTLSANGSSTVLSTTSTVNCTEVPGTGSYQRVLTHVLVLVTATCQVNAWPAGFVTFAATGEFVPCNAVTTPTDCPDANGGDGVNSNISEAFFEGAFSILPSLS